VFVVTLNQAHAASAEDVDGRDDQHRVLPSPGVASGNS
jgi:hypothetical protein